MQKLLLLSTILIAAPWAHAMEKWNTAYQTAMSIKPGESQAEVDKKLDEIHDNLTDFNKQLKNTALNKTEKAVKEADAIDQEQRLLIDQIKYAQQIKNPDQRERELEKLSQKREILRKKRIEWENKYGYSNQPAEYHYNHQTNTNQSNNNSHWHSETETSYYSSSDYSRSHLTVQNGLVSEDVYNIMIEKSKELNRGFFSPQNISARKAIILGTISAGGWITYRSAHRIADYCSTIDNRKLVKTCLYVGAGSAVLIASLYGYKKIIQNKNQPKTPHKTTSNKNSTIDYSSLSNAELQALTRENEQKISESKARQKINQQASDKRRREVKKRADQVDNQSELAGITSDLGDALNDVIKDPRTPARELINDAQHAISNAKTTLTKKWNQFKNWLQS